jgi:hypothetical protein
MEEPSNETNVEEKFGGRRFLMQDQGTSLGTVWVAPGEGATVREMLGVLLMNALAEGWVCSREEKAAESRFRGISSSMMDTRTNLALTGNPLLDYDFVRMSRGLLCFGFDEKERKVECVSDGAAIQNGGSSS